MDATELSYRDLDLNYIMRSHVSVLMELQSVSRCRIQSSSLVRGGSSSNPAEDSSFSASSSSSSSGLGESS